MPIRFNAIGRLGKAWEIRKNHNNTKYLFNTFAVKNSDYETTSWIVLNVYGEKRMETLLRYTKVGSLLAINGNMIINNKDGMTYVNINLENFELIENNKVSYDDKMEELTEKDFDNSNSTAFDNEELLWD